MSWWQQFSDPAGEYKHFSHLYSAYFPHAVVVPDSLECADISHTKDFSSVASHTHTPEAVTPSQPRIAHRLQAG